LFFNVGQNHFTRLQPKPEIHIGEKETISPFFIELLIKFQGKDAEMNIVEILVVSNMKA
jgi:hypothetical protein